MKLEQSDMDIQQVAYLNFANLVVASLKQNISIRWLCLAIANYVSMFVAYLNFTNLVVSSKAYIYSSGG